MRLFKLLVILLVAFGCTKNGDDVSSFDGYYSKQFVYSLNGFGENRADILKSSEVTLPDFIKYSTSKAWELSQPECDALKKVRTSITAPIEKTLLQKVIDLGDVATYMNNIYGGTVGGFVCEASDVKVLSTMYDVYWGLRLDYEGTKHKADGAGYAVIRFYSEAAKTLYTPFCSAMGGTYQSEWPNGGGGFTTSTLGDGGFPEYVFAGYSAPTDGAELYEVTPEGREILRSTYQSAKGGWITNEIGSDPVGVKSSNVIRNGIYTETKGERVIITTYALYNSNKYIVRGKIDGKYHLVSTIKYSNEPLVVVEKGVFGINVDTSDVEKIWEDKRNI